MALTNIEKFNYFAGQALSALYQSFPSPRYLNPGNFIEGGDSAVIDPDGFTGTELTPDAAIFMDTVYWLIAEHYLFGARSQLTFSACVLTAKGLEALNATPDALTNPKPIGERLVEATKACAKETIRTVFGELISAGVKSFVS